MIPAYASVGYVLNTKSPAFVTSGDDAVGDIKMTLFASVIGAAPRVSPEQAPPIITLTLSILTNFCAAAFPSFGLHLLSSSIDSSFLPLMPPFAFISSKAIFMPLCSEMP